MKKISVSVIGDCLVDINVPLGSKSNAPEFGCDLLASGPIECSPGGSAHNTCAHLSSLLHRVNSAAKTTLYTAISADSNDNWNKINYGQAKRAQFDLVNVTSSENFTSGSCVIFSSNKDHGFVTHQGATGEVRASHFATHLNKICASNHIHLAGLYSLTKLKDDLPEFFTEISKEKKGLLSMDTNLDSADIWGGTWTSCLKHVDILFSNQIEAMNIAKCKSVESCLGYFLKKQQVKLVVIKLGKDGSIAGYLVDDVVMTVRAPTQEVDVVDQCGAGDAYCAAFLFTFLQKPSLTDVKTLKGALDAGNRAGAYIVGKRYSSLDFS